MKISLPLVLLVTGLTVCSPSFAVPDGDEQRVKGVVQNFWFASGRMDWSAMEKRLEFPLVILPVGPSYAGETVTYPDKKRFEAHFRNLTGDIQKGLKMELQEAQSGSRISQVRAEIKNQTSAYVTYTYQPNGDKNPYKLMTILKKGRAGWKIIFSTMPH